MNMRTCLALMTMALVAFLLALLCGCETTSGEKQPVPVRYSRA